MGGTMGRKRNGQHHLPLGVYLNRGQLFWRDPEGGKWHKLGTAWDKAAKTKWIELSTGKAAEGTIAEMLDRFMQHCELQVRQGQRSASTHEGNLYDVVALKKVFGASNYLEVTSKHCKVYLNNRTDKNGRHTPVRANREIAFLSSAYSWAMGEAEYEISVNPCKGVRRNAEAPRERYVEAAELRAFEKYGPRWLRCYILLKRLTAMRQGNMLALTDKNLTARGIDYEQNKRGGRRLVRWTKSLRAIVDAIIALRPPLPEGVVALPRPLFFDRYGAQLKNKAFKSAWYRAMKQHLEAGGVSFCEHDIRAKSGSDAQSD